MIRRRRTRIGKKVTLDEDECQVDILDTAGQEEYAAIRDNYYRSGEGFLCVFSLMDRESWYSITEYRDQIFRVLDRNDFSMILVGNKVDLIHERPRKITREEAERKAWEWRCPYYETSAKTRENVDAIYETLLRKVRDSKAAGIARSGVEKKKKGGCLIL